MIINKIIFLTIYKKIDLDTVIFVKDIKLSFEKVMFPIKIYITNGSNLYLDIQQSGAFLEDH